MTTVTVRAARAAAPVLLGLLSCGEPPVIVTEPGAASALVFLERGAVIEALALDLAGQQRGIPSAAAEGTKLTVVFYSLSLDALGLAVGPIPLTPEGRSIPANARSIRAAELKNQRLTPWTELDALPGSLAPVRLPPLDLAACLDRGGCLADAAASLCKLPCTSTVTAPVITPPEPAAAPRIASCPAGWTERREGTLRCEPAGRVCGPDALRLPSGCAALAPCAGEWPVDLPPGVTVAYVSHRAGPEGTGTRDSPFRSLATAIASAAPGTILALSDGAFPGPLRLQAELQLWGACADRTVIQSPAVGPSIEVSAAVILRGLRVAGGAPAMAVARGATVELEGVVIDGAGGVGIDLDGGRVRATVSAIRGSAGAAIRGEGSLELSGLEVSRTSSSGIELRSGEVALDDVAVLGEERAAGTGLMLRAVTGALDHVWISGGAREGLVIESSPGLVLRDALIERTGWSGVHAQSSTVRIERTRIAGSISAALALVQGSTVEVEDVIVDGVPSIPDDTPIGKNGGFAVLLLDSALDLRRFEANRYDHEGLRIEGASNVWLEDVRLTDANVPVGYGGTGLTTNGGTVLGTRLEVKRALSSAVRVNAGRTELSDLVLHDVIAEPAQDNGGHGVTVTGGSAKLSRVSIERVARDGFRIDQGTIEAEDVTVKTATAALRSYSNGVAILRRARIEDVARTGISVERGGQATVSHVELLPPQPEPRTVGINVDRLSRAEVTDFSIRGWRTGVLINDTEQVSLERGVLIDNDQAIACLSAYRLAPLLVCVERRGVGNRIDCAP